MGHNPKAHFRWSLDRSGSLDTHVKLCQAVTVVSVRDEGCCSVALTVSCGPCRADLQRRSWRCSLVNVCVCVCVCVETGGCSSLVSSCGRCEGLNYRRNQASATRTLKLESLAHQGKLASGGVNNRVSAKNGFRILFGTIERDDNCQEETPGSFHRSHDPSITLLPA